MHHILSRRHTLALALALSTPLLPAWAATPGKDTLNIAAPWEINSLEPSRAGFIFSRLQVTETLLEVDADGALAPGLASAWEVSANRLPGSTRSPSSAPCSCWAPAPPPTSGQCCW